MKKSTQSTTRQTSASPVKTNHQPTWKKRTAPITTTQPPIKIPGTQVILYHLAISNKLICMYCIILWFYLLTLAAWSCGILSGYPRSTSCREVHWATTDWPSEGGEERHGQSRMVAMMGHGMESGRYTISDRERRRWVVWEEDLDRTSIVYSSSYLFYSRLDSKTKKHLRAVYK